MDEIHVSVHMVLYSIVMGDINVRDDEGMSPLHCAAQYCRPKHVQVLFEGKRKDMQAVRTVLLSVHVYCLF